MIWKSVLLWKRNTCHLEILEINIVVYYFNYVYTYNLVNLMHQWNIFANFSKKAQKQISKSTIIHTEDYWSIQQLLLMWCAIYIFLALTNMTVNAYRTFLSQNIRYEYSCECPLIEIYFLFVMWMWRVSTIGIFIM